MANKEAQIGVGNTENRETSAAVLLVDVSEGYDSTEKIQIFINFVKSVGLDPEKFYYTGFNGEDINLVLTTGNYRKNEDSVYCAQYSDLLDSTLESNPLTTYAATFSKPAVIVYDPEYLVENGVNYSFAQGKEAKKAVKCIIKVKGLKI